MLRLLVFLALAPGCSDYALHAWPTEPPPGAPTPPEGLVESPAPTPRAPVDPPPTAPAPDLPAPPTLPDIATDPMDIATRGFCAEDTRDVVVRNDGRGPLTVSAVRVVGDGWSMTPVSVPFVLPRGGSATVALTTTGGEGALEIDSDDPDEPLVRVPLSATPNAAPVVTLAAPLADAILPEGLALEVRGAVSDDTDLPEALALTWSASVDGLFAGAPAAPDGSVVLEWPASARTAGHQAMTLTATDSCGRSSSDTVPFCQDATFTYDALDLTGWHFEGEAHYDPDAAWLVLTEDELDVVGTAFETSAPVSADNVTLDFGFYIGEGTGADGISVTALDVTRMSTFLGGTGCGIGYGGDADCTAGPALPGWSIEVDTWYNRGHDPTEADHVAFSFDGQIASPEVWAELPEMEDSGWHTMTVAVVAPHVAVTIDGVAYIDQDIEGDWAFPAYVGFTGGTGTKTNRHIIDSLQVTGHVCD